MKQTFTLFLIGALLFSHASLAGEAEKPLAGRKFISLQAAKSLMVNNKPMRFAEPKFYSLAKGNKAFPLIRTGIVRDSKPLVATETPPTPKNPAPAGTMTQAQANQLLSLFSNAD